MTAPQSRRTSGPAGARPRRARRPGKAAGLILRFSEERWQAVKAAWIDWWAGRLERPLVVLECVEPERARTPHYAGTFLGNYPDQAASDLLDRFVPRLEATHWLGDAFPRFWPNFGPGVVAAFAGARARPALDTTWFSPGKPAPIQELSVACHPANPWWQRVRDVTRAAVERWGASLSVGLTDLGGNLDILASLRGTERLLLDLHDAPGQVDRLVRETTRAWLQCYWELHGLIQAAGRGVTCWGPCWSPASGYMLQSDFSYMISPAMFERFALPDLAACCETLDYPFYHLDGKGQIPHLDRLLALPGLRGIHWAPGDGQPPAECWLPLLRRILDAGKLCQVTVAPQGAHTILRSLGGRGCLLVIEHSLTPGEGVQLLGDLGVPGARTVSGSSLREE